MAHEHNSINVKSDMETNKTIEKSLNLNNNNNSNNNNNNNNFQPSMMAQIFKYENDYNRSSAMKTQQNQNSQVPVNNTINTNMNINNINTTSSSSSSSLLSPSLSSLTTTTTTAQNVSGPAGVGGGNGCGGVLGVGCGSSNSNSNVNGNTASGSAKMGSRRIFTPQFKLQVLQSYRIDSDCKGNQRATARKYGIHRRQIQKWLQCEPNLRSTVDNLNQNNIKHLFHNISPQMPIVKISNKPPQHLTISGNNNNNNSNNNNNVQLSLDTARHSVALASKAMPSSTSSSITTSFGGNNLSGASAVSSSTSISPLRPITTKCINGGSGGNSNTMTVPILPHSTPYKLSSNDSLILTHTPASLTSVPVVPVPMQHIHANLNTHYQSQHHQHHQHHQHQQHLQQFHPQHHHNHHHHQHHHHQHHQRLPFMPSACLPVLSTCISPIPIQSSIPAIPTTTTITTTVCHDDIVSVDGGNSTGNRYINDNDYMKDRNQQIYDGFHYYSHNNNNHNHNYIQETAISDGVAPIDLSVGPKNRQTTDNNVKPFTSESIFQSKSVEFASNSNMDNENKDIAKNENQTESIADENLVVDLTCRKRKNCNSYDTDVDIDVTPEKLQKVIKIKNDEKKSFKNENLEQHLPSSQHQQQQEQQPQQQQAAKPVKLFKPYLMDDDDDKKSSSSSSITTALTLSSSLSSSSNTGCGIEQQYPIIWSHHPNCITPGSYDSGRQCSSRGSNFQSNDSYPFPSGSPIFHGPTIFTTTVPIVSPATTPTAFSCPKGSPVSGYESSSSTYSDSIRSEFYNSCRRINSNDTKSPTSINAINQQQQQQQQLTQHHHPHHTYSIDLKMQPIIHNGYYYDAINDNHQLQHRNHVQQWLDQGTDIRQPLADYV